MRSSKDMMVTDEKQCGRLILAPSWQMLLVKVTAPFEVVPGTSTQKWGGADRLKWPSLPNFPASEASSIDMPRFRIEHGLRQRRDSPSGRSRSGQVVVHDRERSEAVASRASPEATRATLCSTRSAGTPGTRRRSIIGRDAGGHGVHGCEIRQCGRSGSQYHNAAA